MKLLLLLSMAMLPPAYELPRPACPYSTTNMGKTSRPHVSSSLSHTKIMNTDSVIPKTLKFLPRSASLSAAGITAIRSVYNEESLGYNGNIRQRPFSDCSVLQRGCLRCKRLIVILIVRYLGKSFSLRRGDGDAIYITPSLSA